MEVCFSEVPAPKARLAAGMWAGASVLIPLRLVPFPASQGTARIGGE